MKKKSLKIGYYIFLSALGAIALLVIVSAFPITGNLKLMVVRSGSMEPAIGTGSVVIVKPVDNYKIGDIISFQGVRKDEISITHRIYDMRIESGTPIYITKGDANEDPDTREIRSSAIIGKSFISIPYLGYAVETARRPYGFLALILIPAAMIIYDQATRIRKEIMGMRSKQIK